MAADVGKNKVLRIGIIRDGKIAEERLIKASQTVTVGESAKNTFVFPKTRIPDAAFAIFKHTSKGYVLRFTNKMKGKVSTGGAVVSLNKLRKDPTTKREGELWTLLLTDQDRGKVNMDSVTVLFQCVAPPPVKAVKSMKDMDFRPRILEDDDPIFLGWLAIWSALGFVLLLYVWNTEPAEYSLEEIPDRFTKMLVEPKEKPEVPEEKLEIEDPDAESMNRAKEEKVEQSKSEKSKKPTTATEKAQRQDDLKKELLNNNKLLLKMLGTTGESSGGIVADMWSDEDKGLGDIDGALADATGVTTDAGKAHMREGAGGKGEASDIGDLEGVGGDGSADIGSGPGVAVVARVETGVGTMDGDIGDKAGVKAVIRRYAGQLKYCYESRLRSVAGLSGRVEIGWSVYGGKVEGVYVVSNSSGDSELADCIVKKVRNWQFGDDVEGDLSWPFVFRASE